MTRSRIAYQLYLFQLENYHLGRYFRLAMQRLFSAAPAEWRQEFHWTPKARILTGGASVMVFLAAFTFAGLTAWGNFTGILFIVTLFSALLIFIFFFPVFLIIAAFMFNIPESFVQRAILAEAARKIKQFPDLKVVGIAGSYGKTTMKEMVAGVLAERYVVLKTPEIVYTSLGIAELIKKELNEKTQVFVVEMGEYVPGDIAEICAMVHPHFGIVTGINEAHLERMGSIENTVHAVFELAEAASDQIILNADDARVFKNYGQFVDNKKFVGFYSANGSSPSTYFPRSVVFHEDGSGYSFELEKEQKTVGRFETPLLAEYAIGVALAALLIGTAFGLDIPTIAEGIKKVRPPKHRMEVVPTANGVLVIDDGYNGNPDGVSEAVRTLSKFRGRRKIYVTPGLVEMGSAAERVHAELGNQLAGAADIVILIKNSVTDYILKGLSDAGFKSDNIKIFASAGQAHEAIGGIVQSGDVVLFQNDWTDNYF